MAQVDRNAYVTVTIGTQIRSATEWISEAPIKPSNGIVSVQIPPGGISIVEIR
jgi:hypothetical protein